MSARRSELKSLPYEIFIAALTVLSIINIALTLILRDPMVVEIVTLMNGLLTIVFIGDFIFRIVSAESRSGYFFRQYGWADLLSCIPIANVKILRLFRLIRAVRLVRHLGREDVRADLLTQKANTALLSVLLLLFLLLEFGGMAVYSAERNTPDANITSATDAIWFTYVTMTTVGYGDKYPVTNPGRFVSMVIMAAGVGLFGALTGYVANAVLTPRRGLMHKRAKKQASALEATIMELHDLLEASKNTQAELEDKLIALEQQLIEKRREQKERGGEGGIRTPERDRSR